MTHQYILFHLDDQPYALPIARVERVVRAVTVTPVALAPPLMLGVINVQGRIIPVLSLRKLFGLADCVVAPAHQFLLVSTRGRTVALVVDAVTGLLDGVDREMKVADTLLPGCSYLEGQDGQSTGMVTVLALDTLLAAAGVQLPAEPGQQWGAVHAAA